MYAVNIASARKMVWFGNGAATGESFCELAVRALAAAPSRHLNLKPFPNIYDIDFTRDYPNMGLRLGVFKWCDLCSTMIFPLFFV